MQVLNPTHTPLDPRVIVVGAVDLPSHWTDEFKTFVRKNLVASEIVPLLRAEREQIQDPKHVPFFVEQAMRRYVERILDGNPDYPVLPDVLYRVDLVEVEGGSVRRYVEAELLDLSCYRLSEEAEAVEWPYHWTLMYRQFVFDNLEPEAVKELFSIEVSAREQASLASVHELSVEDESRIASDAMDAYAATAGLPKFEGKFIHDPAPSTELEEPSSESQSEATMTTTSDPTRLPSHWMPAFQEFVRTKLNEAQALYLIRFEQDLRIDAPNAGPFAIARKLRHETINLMRENNFSDEEIKALTWEVIATDPSVQVEIINLGPSTTEVEANLEAVETADVETTTAAEEVVVSDAAADVEEAGSSEDLLSTITPTTDAGFPGHWTLRFTKYLIECGFTAEDVQYLATMERQLRSGDMDFDDNNEDAPLLDRVEARLTKTIVEDLSETYTDVPHPLFDRTVPYDDGGVLMVHAEDGVEDESDMSADAGTPIDAFPFTAPNVDAVRDAVHAHYESQVPADADREELPAPPAEVLIDTDTLVETTTEALVYPKEWSVEFSVMMDRMYDRRQVEEAIQLQGIYSNGYRLQELVADTEGVDVQRLVELRIVHTLGFNKATVAAGNSTMDFSTVKIETMDELRKAPVADTEAHIDDTEISNALGGYHLEITEGPLPELNGKFPLRVRRSGYPVVFLYGTEAFRDTAWHDVQEARKREEQQAKVPGFGVPLSDIPRSTGVAYDPAMAGHSAEDREAAAAASLRRAGERVTRHAEAQAERRLDPNHTVEMTLDASDTDRVITIRFINLSEVLKDLVTVLATRQLPERFEGSLLGYVQFMHVTLIDLMRDLRAAGFDETNENYDTAQSLVEQIKSILDDLTVL